MGNFLFVTALLFGAYLLGSTIGEVEGKREIWDSCVSSGQFKAKSTEFACQPIKGEWDGQPVTFPKKTP